MEFKSDATQETENRKKNIFESNSFFGCRGLLVGASYASSTGTVANL